MGGAALWCARRLGRHSRGSPGTLVGDPAALLLRWLDLSGGGESAPASSLDHSSGRTGFGRTSVVVRTACNPHAASTAVDRKNCPGLVTRRGALFLSHSGSARLGSPSAGSAVVRCETRRCRAAGCATLFDCRISAYPASL